MMTTRVPAATCGGTRVRTPFESSARLKDDAAVWFLMPVAEAAADIIYISLPHDANADSPNVAIIQIVQLAITLTMLSPFFALLVWLVWRRYSGARRLFWSSPARQS